ncbi:MAG: hypothetical protein ABII71_00980 [Candidatus Micrarchaeota archaeon]
MSSATRDITPKRGDKAEPAKTKGKFAWAGEKGMIKLRFLDLTGTVGRWNESVSERLLRDIELYMLTSFHNGRGIAGYEAAKAFRSEIVGEAIERMAGVSDPLILEILEDMDVTMLRNIELLHHMVDCNREFFDNSKLVNGRARFEVDGLPDAADVGGYVGRGLRVSDITSTTASLEWNDEKGMGFTTLALGKEEWVRGTWIKLVKVKESG